jgi:CBS domain-containing protein
MLRLMNVEQLMSRDVVAVSQETSLKDAAALLSSHGISGVPVCDAAGQVLGVVSEADILLKEEGRDPEGACSPGSSNGMTNRSRRLQPARRVRR